MNVHILGICGTLMGSIALLAKEKGHTVTGSDENVYPPMSTQLAESGIEISTSYSANSIPTSTEMVIIGNANLQRGTPAVEALLNARIPYTSGAEWLGRYLLRDRWVIGVAGTHGKTTTSSMIAWILESAGLSPGFLIGGVPQNFEQSSRLGKKPFFVIEADEYDTSYFDRRSKFLHYQPRTLVLNNLEFDHADIFNDIEAIKYQFHLLLRSIPGDGLVIHPSSDTQVLDVINQGCWTPRLQTGTQQLCARAISADFSALAIQLEGKEVGEIQWALSGQHNASNALSAIAAARHAGIPVDIACEALSAFSGVKRRMEILYTNDKVTIYDDFAHHPTSIQTTLQGLRLKVGNERIIAVIEPASHTMRKGTHADTLAKSSGSADETLWFQPDDISWDMSKLESNSSQLISNHQTLVRTIIERAGSHTNNLHIVIMSNGSFGGIHNKIVQSIRT